MEYWYIIRAGIPSRALVALTPAPLETEYRWFESSRLTLPSPGVEMYVDGGTFENQRFLETFYF